MQQQTSVDEAIRAALVPAVITGLGLAVANLVLWDRPWMRRRWSRPVCYVIGTLALEAGFAAWAARRGQWEAVAAHATIVTVSGGAVLSLWAAHALAELAEAGA